MSYPLWSVWYKTKVGSQNCGYQFWFCTRLVMSQGQQRSMEIWKTCWHPGEACVIWVIIIRDHFAYAPSQREMALQCNVVSHWLDAFTKWSLNSLVHVIACRLFNVKLLTEPTLTCCQLNSHGRNSEIFVKIHISNSRKCFQTETTGAPFY